MIFFYYFTIPLLLYNSVFDFIAILVFLVTIGSLVFQLRLWKSLTGTDKFMRMFKLWKWVYFAVTVLCIWRYLMFFTRFATFERVSVHFMSSLSGTEIDPNLSSPEQLQKIGSKWLALLAPGLTKNNQRFDLLHSEYYVEIIMIIINFMTYLSLQRRLALPEATRKNEAIRKTRASLFIKRSTNLNPEKPAEEPQSGATEAELAENLGDRKVTEPDEKYVISEEDLLPVREKPHIGIIIFILLSMSTITFFINLFVYNNTNPLKVVVLIFPILYSNRLFIGIYQILSRYKFRVILRLAMRYFDRQFV